MGHSLYVTYTQELKDHVTKLLDVARKAGWNDVVDGPGDSPYANSVARSSQAQKADALIVVSAFAYGAEPGQSEQELIWDSFRSTGKPACALLLADSATWPIPWIEGFHRPERKPALEAFQSKLKRPSFFAVFGEKPDTIAEPARQQLQILRSALRAAAEIKVFLVWDFTVTGLSMLLASLAKRPPEGFKLSVPGLEGGAGEVFRDVVLPGIKNSDRVLVVTDKPNANVAFEAGLALGFNKPLSLVHFGSDRPSWLNYSLFNGFLVNSIRTLDDLRLKITTENSWFKPGKSPALPTYGPTLFLAPTSYVGAALHETQREGFRHWRKPYEAANFNDISQTLGDIAQAVWAISVYSDGTDIRDGAENAANAVVAGWFYARADAVSPSLGGRLSILRQEQARPLVDVQVPELLFKSIDEFESLLRRVPDVRLPSPEALPTRDVTQGTVQYRMVKVPPLRTGERPIWVGVYAVTNAQYRAFCKATNHPMPTYLHSDFLPNAPVTEISLQDAEEFCRWASLDLPTPEMWRHFACSGSSGRYWWGDDESPLERAAWFLANSENRLHEIGTLHPNKWGLYDVLGNVWELTRYQELEEDRDRNQILATKAETLGGAFNTPASELLASIKRTVSYRDQFTGFRCIFLDES